MSSPFAIKEGHAGSVRIACHHRMLLLFDYLPCHSILVPSSSLNIDHIPDLAIFFLMISPVLNGVSGLGSIQLLVNSLVLLVKFFSLIPLQALASVFQSIAALLACYALC